MDDLGFSIDRDEDRVDRQIGVAYRRDGRRIDRFFDLVFRSGYAQNDLEGDPGEEKRLKQCDEGDQGRPNIEIEPAEIRQGDPREDGDLRFGEDAARALGGVAPQVGEDGIFDQLVSKRPSGGERQIEVGDEKLGDLIDAEQLATEPMRPLLSRPGGQDDEDAFRSWNGMNSYSIT